MNNIIKNLRQELISLGNSEIARTKDRFFKEEVKHYGIMNSELIKIAKRYFKQIKDMSKSDIFRVCEELFASGYMEECIIACNWSYSIHKQYEKSDFKIFQNWIENYVTNWAVCDTLCNHTVGEFIEMYPEFISELKEWTESNNRWVRRASSVTLIVPAKKGKFLQEIFEISDKLLTDEDDLVQKGYGWMLKSATHTHEQEVFEYVMKNKSVMPRTALRYAIEKMDKELKIKAMKK